MTQFCEPSCDRELPREAEELATRLFPQGSQGYAVHFEEDSEDGDQYLVLEVLAKGDEDECFDAYKSYLRTWANSVGWPEVRLIRLTYDAV